MSAFGRLVAYGLAVLLILAGAVCAAAIGGETGEVLALVLIGLGFVGVVFRVLIHALPGLSLPSTFTH